MDSIFKISKLSGCGITINGLELDNKEYLEEDNLVVSRRTYTYKQSITLNILEHLTAELDTKLESYKVVLHNVDCIDECHMNTEEDGLYAIYHIILPTNSWLQYVLDVSPEALDMYSSIYFYNELNGTFNEYRNGDIKQVEVSEILEINDLADVPISDKTTTIIKSAKSTFQLCHLMKCFQGIISELLKALPVRCEPNPHIKTLQQHRDLLWMAINVIKYLLELGKYFEAARILENFTTCNLICKPDSYKLNSKGCDCFKE